MLNVFSFLEVAMSPIVLTYAAYLVLSLGLTIWVARTLHRNGRVFLLDVFRGQADLADSVNHLLVVGFYLVNLGYVSLRLRIHGDVADTRAGIEALADHVGGVLVALGVMHFFNLYVFSRIRRRATLNAEPPPVLPNAGVHPPAPARG